MEKQIEEMARIMLEESQKANVEPVLEIEGKEIVLGEIITKILDNILGQAFIPFLAEILYKQGYRKQVEAEWILHRPRVKGRNATYKCSVCKKLVSSYYNDVSTWKCCPHCEAKMKGN